MKAYPLVRVGESVPRVWVCGACNITARSEADASRCCLCHVCEERTPSRPYHACAECQRRLAAERAEKDDAKLLALLRRAARLTPAEYTGPVCACEDGDEDSYYPTAGDYEDCVDDDPESRQPYVWACTTSPPTLDVDSILETAAENADVPDDWDWMGVEALRELLAAWRARQDDVWMVDTTRVVVLDSSRFEALIAPRGETPEDDDGGAAAAGDDRYLREKEERG